MKINRKATGTYIGPKNLPSMDVRINYWIDYTDEFEGEEYIIATCINYDNNNPFKMRLRKSDLKWILNDTGA